MFRADTLDANDMVVDFKAIKQMMGDFLQQFDHSLCVNTDDPNYAAFVAAYGERIIPFDREDIAAGYDSITGAGIVLCGAGAGFAGAFINPFTIQVAQGIAQVELLSGMTFRIVMYACLLLLTILFMLRYAAKVKKNPTLSTMHEIDQKREDSIDLDSLPEFTGRRKAILVIFVIAIIFLVYAVITCAAAPRRRT